jgi:BlaI family penicillinase repressor
MFDLEKIPVISDSEWEVMRAIWHRGEMTAAEAIDSIADEMDWSPKTVRTLLSRLVSKNVLAIKQETRPFVYYPLVSEAACQSAVTKSFFKRIYNGTFKHFLVNFVEEGELSQQDIDNLKQILQEKESNGKL